ncbi:MAG TPA: hypothetical protein VG935_03345 [Patescibacteria group bacterium]|nr:hypothetical protein [Patescibacteria group bacterium]
MKGQSLVEVAVALGIGVLILTSMTLIVITSLSNSEQSTSTSGGTQYVQEGMEIMRNMRDNDWNTFLNLSSGTYCLASTCSELSSSGSSCGPMNSTCGLNVANKYSRQVIVSQADSSCRPANLAAGAIYAKVTTIVSWTDTKCLNSSTYCHSVRADSCLSNYSSRPAP